MNKTLNLLILFLFFIFAQNLKAQQACSTRDFRTQLGPVRNQGDLSWCYAFSTADLISQRVGQIISAADIAATFQLQDVSALGSIIHPEFKKFMSLNPNLLDKIREDRAEAGAELDFKNILKSKGLKDAGGQEDTALILANTKGLCLEKDFPSTDAHQNKFFKDAVKLVNQRIKYHNQFKQCWIGQAQTDLTSAIDDPLSVVVAQMFQDEVEKKCKRLYQNQVFLPHVTEYAKDSEKFSLINKTEQEKAHIDLIKNLNVALENGKAAAIGYNAYTILKKDKDETAKHASHSSVIAGRKLINGQCHYLLRNSHGPACSDYLEKFKKRCELGHLWVTEDELKNSLFSVTYIK